MEKAFTYGLKLNRQGLTPITTQRERMFKFFQDKEMRRLLWVLRTKKGRSVCGNRDGNFVQQHRLQCKNGAKKMRPNGLMSSRRSLSIYSERQGDDKTKFEWRYRVKNRDHIPDFFDNFNDSI